ncbi:MAG: hypothetical protein D6797_03730 [Bdellovibrio sp.]|nr:MAG: hypothetical protein D6797_03730 [Bdellovibrio sp.]
MKALIVFLSLLTMLGCYSTNHRVKIKGSSQIQKGEKPSQVSESGDNESSQTTARKPLGTRSKEKKKGYKVSALKNSRDSSKIGKLSGTRFSEAYRQHFIDKEERHHFSEGNEALSFQTVFQEKSFSLKKVVFEILEAEEPDPLLIVIGVREGGSFQLVTFNEGIAKEIFLKLNSFLIPLDIQKGEVVRLLKVGEFFPQKKSLGSQEIYLASEVIGTPLEETLLIKELQQKGSTKVWPLSLLPLVQQESYRVAFSKTSELEVLMKVKAVVEKDKTYLWKFYYQLTDVNK